MNEHHLADLPNSEALPTADMSSAELKNLGYPLGSAGLFNSLINFAQTFCAALFESCNCYSKHLFILVFQILQWSQTLFEFTKFVFEIFICT